MAFCERLSEQLALVATIDPIDVPGTVAVSDIFSMQLHRRALFVLQTGATFVAGTVLIQEGAAVGMTAGTTATILTGAATAITAVASQYLFEVSAEAMAAGNSFLRASIAGLTIGDFVSMVVLADVERYHPGSDRNLVTTTISGVAN